MKLRQGSIIFGPFKNPVVEEGFVGGVTVAFHLPSGKETGVKDAFIWFGFYNHVVFEDACIRFPGPKVGGFGATVAYNTLPVEHWLHFK